MRHVIGRLTALLALTTAIVAASALPAAAYAPDDAITVSAAAVDPGGSVRLSAQSGTFSPDERLTITVRGENAGSVVFALARTAIETATHTTSTANAGGGLDAVTITFPEDARGAYTVEVFSASTPGGSVTVTVGGLSSTGLDAQSLLGIWVGGGALVLAGVVVLAAVLLARRRRAADAA